MSKKICRTCLKRTYKTYKTHENISYPGETEQLKISDMLRYLIPELVSLNSLVACQILTAIYLVFGGFDKSRHL